MPVVKNEEVIDRWSILIENVRGGPEFIFKNTEQFLEQTEVPDIHVSRRMIAPGILRGLFGEKREFLVVLETQNSRLRPYQMFIGARDYGNNLDVCWYLTYRLNFEQRLAASMRALPVINIFFIGRGYEGAEMAIRKLDLFDEQDLRAYVTNAHRCVIKAVTKVLTQMKRDPSQIDRKSKGFLGIS